MTDVQTPIEISTYYPESIIPKPSGERYTSGASLIAHNIYVDSPVASKNATLIVAVSTKSLLHSSSKQYFN